MPARFRLYFLSASLSTLLLCHNLCRNTRHASHICHTWQAVPSMTSWKPCPPMCAWSRLWTLSVHLSLMRQSEHWTHKTHSTDILAECQRGAIVCTWLAGCESPSVSQPASAEATHMSNLSSIHSLGDSSAPENDQNFPVQARQGMIQRSLLSV